MLDALKFAFEILIVGALATPWIAVLSRMFPGRESSEFKFDLGFVPSGARSGVEIAVVLAFGYLVGSAASRFSRDFFNDELVNANSHYSDPPLAEIVILLLAGIGLLVAWKPEGSKPGKEMPYVRICCIALVLMVVSFGGWWWTEVMYDLQVIHSLAEMSETGETKPAANDTTGKGRELSSTTKPAAQTQTSTAAEEIKPH